MKKNYELFYVLVALRIQDYSFSYELYNAYSHIFESIRFHCIRVLGMSVVIVQFGFLQHGAYRVHWLYLEIRWGFAMRTGCHQGADSA